MAEVPAGSKPRDRSSYRFRVRLLADLPLILTDAVLVCLSYVVAMALRFDGAVPPDYWRRLPGVMVLAVVVYVVLFAASHLYGPLWLQAGPNEAWNLVVASGVATTLLVGATFVTWPERLLPLSVPVNAGALALLSCGGVRFSQRMLASRSGQPAPVIGATPLVVVGPVGRVRPVLAQMKSDPALGLLPVGVVTDESGTWGRTIFGVPVLGPVDGLGGLVHRCGAQLVLLVRSGRAGDGEEVGRVAELAHDAGVAMKVMPTVLETSGRTPRLRDIRDVSVEDLLDRQPITIDDAAVLRVVSGRRVLVTGAGGSIGSEIAAQLSMLDPAELILLDHDETHLHDAVTRLHGPGRCVLGDIRDDAFITQLFSETRPEVVFHAAAHKHVPILEEFPSEAVRTNVLGTDVLVRAARRCGTQTFVAISTDKAVNPSSVMGATKRLSEQLLLHRAEAGLRFCVVRFGNVLGSRGSVVPTFLRQARHGGPLTVTHPDMTRFFMTTREAVQLVLQAAASSRGGELFMLDMGEPVRILDLAERIIALTASRRDDGVTIEFTGLRPGEKLAEELSSQDEVVERSEHSKIFRVRSPLLPKDVLLGALGELASLSGARSEQATRDLLFRLALPSGPAGATRSVPTLVQQDGRHRDDYSVSGM